MLDLSYVLSRDQDHAFVTARGDLDAIGAARLRRLLHVLAWEGSHHLRVDLTKVVFADAGGVGVLARRWVSLPVELGVSLDLEAASAPFWRAVVRSGRDDLFGKIPDLTAAS